MSDRIEKWLDVKSGSENTRRVYRSRIKWFLAFHNISVEDLFTKQREELEGLINDYLVDLKRRQKSGYHRRAIVVALISFLKFYDIDIRNGKLMKAEAEPEGEDEIPNREMLGKLFDHADTRTKAIMAFPAFSAIRFQGISNMKLKHLTDLKVNGDSVEVAKMPMHIHIPRKTDDGRIFEKMGIKHETFMIEQGCRYVEECLNMRIRSGEKLGGESYVIVPVDNVERMNPSSIGTAIQRHFKKMGYRERPYVLKKYCESRMLASGMKESYQRFFSGWKAGRDLIMRYSLAVKMTPEQVDGLRAEYVKAEPYLTTRPSELEAELEQKLEKRDKILEFLQSENLELKSRLRRIEETRKESDNVMDRLFEDPKFMAALRERLRELKV